MRKILTCSFDHLGDFGELLALVHSVHTLDSENLAVNSITVSVGTCVHGPLERVAFPAEQIVSVRVLTKASPI